MHRLFLPLLFLLSAARAIKFSLPSSHYPTAKCIWNTAHADTLVIVTANVSPDVGEQKNYQRVDIEIIDMADERLVYLSKRNIKGETRLAITTHVEGDFGVCFKNWLDQSAFLLVPFFLFSVAD